MKIFIVVLDLCVHTKGVFKMMNGFIKKYPTTVVSVRNNVYKYRAVVNKKKVSIEVVSVESSNPDGSGRRRLDEISKATKRNIAAFPTILKQKGNKYVELIPSVERTRKNFVKFLE
tara:strand:- start:636 stop:983 length:348 start_codon:yes stop_codon:yes gene_type:complete